MSFGDKKPGETQKELGMRLQVLVKSLELMTASFSLVAALAWNDAIQALFLRVFGQTNGVLAKFIYAIVVTAVIVMIIVRISRMNTKLDKTINQ